MFICLFIIYLFREPDVARLPSLGPTAGNKEDSRTMKMVMMVMILMMLVVVAVMLMRMVLIIIIIIIIELSRLIGGISAHLYTYYNI